MSNQESIDRTINGVWGSIPLNNVEMRLPSTRVRGNIFSSASSSSSRSPPHHPPQPLCRPPEAPHGSSPHFSACSQAPASNGLSPPSQPSQPHGPLSRSTFPPRTRPSSTSRSSTTSSRPLPKNQPCSSCTPMPPASSSGGTKTPGSKSIFPSCIRLMDRPSASSVVVAAVGLCSMI